MKTGNIEFTILESEDSPKQFATAGCLSEEALECLRKKLTARLYFLTELKVSDFDDFKTVLFRKKEWQVSPNKTKSYAEGVDIDSSTNKALLAELLDVVIRQQKKNIYFGMLKGEL